MCTKAKPSYYRLELDYYSAPSFTSFGKYYYGTPDEFRCLFNALARNEKFNKRFKDLIQVFDKDQQDLELHDAYKGMPFLVPVCLLHKEKIVLENYEWTHINTWECPYYMRCDRVESEHFWFVCDGEYHRVTKAIFTKLQYAATIGQWSDVGSMFWGFPGILFGDLSGCWNRLAEPEKHFQTCAEAQQDWESFSNTPDPNYSEFCNDIFGDG